MARFRARAPFYYVRIRIESWRCFAIIDEPRVVAQAVADALAEQWPDNEVAVHTRHDVRTPAQQRRAVEQSRLEWDQETVAAYIEEARALRKKAPDTWTNLAAHSALRSLVELESAIISDPRDSAKVASSARMPVDTIEAIRNGGRLIISLDARGS